VVGKRKRRVSGLSDSKKISALEPRRGGLEQTCKTQQVDKETEGKKNSESPVKADETSAHHCYFFLNSLMGTGPKNLGSKGTLGGRGGKNLP